MDKNVVLLYNPRITSKEKQASTVFMPPLSLLAIASPLLSMEIDVIIWDGNFADDMQLDQIDWTKVICCGITAMTGPQIKDGILFSKKVKSYNPNIKIIWGGVHVSLMPEESIKSDAVDVIVLGQGEETFFQVVSALKNGKQLAGINGLFVKEHGTIYRNDERNFVDISKYPMLPYELLPMERYLKESYNKRLRTSNSFNSETDIFTYYYSSVGCPFACKFCASSVHSRRKWIGFSAERVLSEIEILINRYGITFLQMTDAEFFIDIKRALCIAQGFIDLSFNIKWKAQIRADTLSKLTDEDLILLKKSGYIHAEVGVETGSKSLLQYIDKRITPEQVISGAIRLKKNEIPASFIFIFGLPNENSEEIKDSFRLATSLKKIMPECLLPIYFFTPFPGVPLYYDAIKMGMSVPNNFEAWGNVDFNMREYCNWVPWLNSKYVDKCHKVIIFYLPLAFPANIKLGTITMLQDKINKGPHRLLWRLMHKTALWRVKMNFYALPVEWLLFKMWNRCRKNLPKRLINK